MIRADGFLILWASATAWCQDGSNTCASLQKYWGRRSYFSIQRLNFALKNARLRKDMYLHLSDRTAQNRYYRNTPVCVPTALGASPDIWTHQQLGIITKPVITSTIRRRKLKNFQMEYGTRVWSSFFNSFFFLVFSFEFLIGLRLLPMCI